MYENVGNVGTLYRNILKIFWNYLLHILKKYSVDFVEIFFYFLFKQPNIQGVRLFLKNLKTLNFP